VTAAEAGATNGWVTSAAASGGSAEVTVLDVVVDGAGNSYIAGHFQGTATLGSFVLQGNIVFDMFSPTLFVAKLDTSGKILWAVAPVATSGANSAAHGIALDCLGNVYVTGYFGGSATFGTTQCKCTSCVLVAKLDPQGTFAWVALSSGGLGGGGAGWAIAVSSAPGDGFGHSHVAGRLAGTESFGATTLTAAGIWDILVAEVDGAGNWVGALAGGGTGYDDGMDIAFHPATGDTVVTGSFEGPGNLGPRALTSKGNRDVLVARLHGQVPTWVVTAGGANDDVGNSVAVDGNGMVRLTGAFKDSASFGATTLQAQGTDAFVAKLDAKGQWQWATQVGGPGSVIGWAIALDGIGNHYLASVFTGGLSCGSTLLNSQGSGDIALVKLDPAGNVVGAIAAGGTLNDTAFGIGLDGAASIHLVGASKSTTATFGSTVVNFQGEDNGYVWKVPAGVF
jgi:hypothetical protein